MTCRLMVTLQHALLKHLHERDGVVPSSSLFTGEKLRPGGVKPLQPHNSRGGATIQTQAEPELPS